MSMILCSLETDAASEVKAAFVAAPRQRWRPSVIFVVIQRWSKWRQRWQVGNEKDKDGPYPPKDGPGVHWYQGLRFKFS